MWKRLVSLFKPQITRPLVSQKQVISKPDSFSHPDLPPMCGLFLIQQLEGFKDKAYPDQKGIWTIGYGHTRSVKEGDTCTKQQAMGWLSEDCGTAWQALHKLVKVPLTQNQAGALLSFVYNIGVGAFEESGVLRALNYGHACDVPPAMRKWCKITVKGVATFDKGLANRREKEISLFIGTGSDWRVS